jgi:hypothetical protein
MFSINTPSDFLRKANEHYRAFEQDIANPGLAMDTILYFYHLHEWVWARWLKQMAPTTIRETTIRDEVSFVDWLEHFCPHFALLQELANGSKHCSPTHSTQLIQG